mmetsp:Transcript_20411/g.23131  ORF Transcript_20411/g.23131 Transcript_20411/m.23131 type:complete len:256 (+) Transcript_20411:63-830(+)
MNPYFRAIPYLVMIDLFYLTIDTVVESQLHTACNFDFNISYLFCILYVWNFAILLTFFSDTKPGRRSRSFFRAEYKFVLIAIYGYFLIRCTIEFLQKADSSDCFSGGVSVSTLIWFWIGVGYTILIISIIDCTLQNREDHNAELLARLNGDNPELEEEGTQGLSGDEIERIHCRRVSAIEHYDYDCAICLNELKLDEPVRLLPNCQHCFHQDCIDGWLRTTPSCPMCRRNVRDELDTTQNADRLTSVESINAVEN